MDDVVTDAVLAASDRTTEGVVGVVVCGANAPVAGSNANRMNDGTIMMNNLVNDF